ncbi:MAG: ABC transporter permease [Chlamydiales bacterium]|nr:ABC transporter permease [Chlamydiales bacterium]
MLVNSLSINVIWQLLRRDLTIFLRDYPGKFFNSFMLFFTTAMVFGYFIPGLSTGGTFGPFIVLSAIGLFGLFEVIGRVIVLLNDIEGARTIKQSLLYPVPSEWIFIYTACSWALYTMLISAPLLVFAKLFLWNQFSFGTIHWGKFVLIFLSANLFHGFFALWLTSVLKASKQMDSIYFRVVNPLFMFGAYFYPWATLFDVAPWLGYLVLVNPMVYISEAFHAAGVGQEGFLPYWSCIGVLWLFILALGTHAVRKLKRRLDCV